MDIDSEVLDALLERIESGAALRARLRDNADDWRSREAEAVRRAAQAEAKLQAVRTQLDEATKLLGEVARRTSWEVPRELIARIDAFVGSQPHVDAP